MLKIGVVLWVLLTLILLWFPIGFGIYFLSKRGIKISRFFLQKVNEVKTLDKMRQDILQKRVEENESENIRWGMEDLSEDTTKNTFDKEKKESTNINSDKLEKDDSSHKNVGSDTISHTNDTKDKSSEIKSEVIGEEKKELNLKQKKMLEKVKFEAIGLKKEWKLELYEKKLIEWLALDPDNMEFNQLLADLYFTIWNHNKALSLLKRLIEDDPQNHNAIRQIGEIYLITGDFETAELLVEKAIGLKPSNPKYYISLVEVFYNTNRRVEAINIMEKVVRLRPTNANYVYTLASLYEESWDMENAKKYYFRVLECEPSNEKAKKKLKNIS